MRAYPSSAGPAVRTRLDCARTNGYNVKRGALYYEWCPFCGHRTDDEEHEVVVEAES